MDGARGAAEGIERVVFPVCAVAERELDVLSPEPLMDVRDTGGGGATREDADGGETTRACLGDTTVRPGVPDPANDDVAADDDIAAGPPATFAVRPVTAAFSFPSLTTEVFAVELGGVFPFTKRCSLASYTIAAPAAEAAPALPELTVRARRAGVVEGLACETKVSRGGSFTTFHLVLAASEACSTPARVVTGMMPCVRFKGVLP